MKTGEDLKEHLAKVSFDASQKIIEFRKLWMERYPDHIEQTYYNLAMGLLDSLQTVVRLSAGVEE